MIKYFFITFVVFISSIFLLLIMDKYFSGPNFIYFEFGLISLVGGGLGAMVGSIGGHIHIRKAKDRYLLLIIILQFPILGTAWLFSNSIISILYTLIIIIYSFYLTIVLDKLVVSS